VQQDLKKSPCAKHFGNIANTIKKVGEAGFADLGNLTFTTAKNGSVTGEGALAGLGSTDSNVFSYRDNILLNSQVNWAVSLRHSGNLRRQSGAIRPCRCLAFRVNEPSMTPQQFMDLEILHEADHYNGYKNPDTLKEERALWKDCVK